MTANEIRSCIEEALALVPKFEEIGDFESAQDAREYVEDLEAILAKNAA